MPSGRRLLESPNSARWQTLAALGSGAQRGQDPRVLPVPTRARWTKGGACRGTGVRPWMALDRAARKRQDRFYQPRVDGFHVFRGKDIPSFWEGSPPNSLTREGGDMPLKKYLSPLD